MDKQRLRKTIIWIIVGIFVFIGAGQIPKHLIYTKTPSLKYRWFIRKNISTPSEIKKGDYVTFMHVTDFYPGCKPSPCKLTKMVSCMEGDLLEVNGMQFFCNKEIIATAKAISLKGTPLTHFEFNGIIPPGKIFLTGDNKDSYDSRYFGFKERQDVQEIAIPIL